MSDEITQDEREALDAILTVDDLINGDITTERSLPSATHRTD
jgi:hypothetical protein